MNPFIQLDEHHIHELTRKDELVALMEKTFRDRLDCEDLSPPRFALGHSGNTMGIMPELSRQNPSVLQTKFVSLTPGKGHSGTVTRFDLATGKLLATINGKLFTSMRTAASSLAVARKIKPDAKTIFIVGKGEQGIRHEEFFRYFYPDAKITLAGRSVDPHQRSADIICTVTSSPTPILKLEDVKENALVIAVGSCHSQKRELTTDLVIASHRFVDSIPQMKREAGDYILAAQENSQSLENFCNEIGPIMRSENTPMGRIIYKSLGLAEQDIAFADYLLEKYLCSTNP